MTALKNQCRLLNIETKRAKLVNINNITFILLGPSPNSFRGKSLCCRGAYVERKREEKEEGKTEIDVGSYAHCYYFKRGERERACETERQRERERDRETEKQRQERERERWCVRACVYVKRMRSDSGAEDSEEIQRFSQTTVVLTTTSLCPSSCAVCVSSDELDAPVLSWVY